MESERYTVEVLCAEKMQAALPQIYKRWKAYSRTSGRYETEHSEADAGEALLRLNGPEAYTTRTRFATHAEALRYALTQLDADYFGAPLILDALKPEEPAEVITAHGVAIGY